MEKKVDYRIKLLPGNKLVLVHSENYEPEIFFPQIVNGRITLLNALPNRRCCQVSKTNVMNFAKRELQKSIKSEHFRRISANEELAISAPLANSTPANIKQRYSCNSQLSKFNSHLSTTNSTLPTPELVRKAVKPRSMLFENDIVLPPRGTKVSSIYHNPVESIPIIAQCPAISSNSVTGTGNSDVSFLDGSFKLPVSSSVSSTQFNNENLSKNAFHSTPVDCIARWEKVLKPLRTYTRKTKQPNNRGPSKTVARAETARMTSTNVTPTYLHNPTQGLNVSQEIEIKKCKLIKDIRTIISPRTFKKQQNQSLDAHSIKSNSSIHPHSLSFHKPRFYLETMDMTAFDMLTNSNRSRMIARKLHEQFRKGCINKASSTYVKYKVLSTVPSIQQDGQVLELSRISLEASQT